jgi:hypothetical protein
MSLSETQSASTESTRKRKLSNKKSNNNTKRAVGKSCSSKKKYYSMYCHNCDEVLPFVSYSEAQCLRHFKTCFKISRFACSFPGCQFKCFYKNRQHFYVEPLVKITSDNNNDSDLDKRFFQQAQEVDSNQFNAAESEQYKGSLQNLKRSLAPSTSKLTVPALLKQYRLTVRKIRHTPVDLFESAQEERRLVLEKYDPERNVIRQITREQYTQMCEERLRGAKRPGSFKRYDWRARHQKEISQQNNCSDSIASTACDTTSDTLSDAMSETMSDTMSDDIVSENQFSFCEGGGEEEEHEEEEEQEQKQVNEQAATDLIHLNLTEEEQVFLMETSSCCVVGNTASHNSSSSTRNAPSDLPMYSDSESDPEWVPVQKQHHHRATRISHFANGDSNGHRNCQSTEESRKRRKVEPDSSSLLLLELSVSGSSNSEQNNTLSEQCVSSLTQDDTVSASKSSSEVPPAVNAVTVIEDASILCLPPTEASTASTLSNPPTLSIAKEKQKEPVQPLHNNSIEVVVASVQQPKEQVYLFVNPQYKRPLRYPTARIKSFVLI